MTLLVSPKFLLAVEHTEKAIQVQTHATLHEKKKNGETQRTKPRAQNTEPGALKTKTRTMKQTKGKLASCTCPIYPSL